MENKKKTKGFVQTPSSIVNIFHVWLKLNEQDALGDFTAGRGALFLNHKKENCYGIELDDDNFHLIKKDFPNISQGDFFEKISEMPIVDALVLNPPYNKKSNEMIFKSLGRLKENGKFAILSKKSTLLSFRQEFPECEIDIEYVIFFGDKLFKPFAAVETMLILGTKRKTQGEYSIADYKNENIIVNTRAKQVEPKLLQPNSIIKGTGDLWENLAQRNSIDTIPKLEDFKKTIINYMAWESGLPRQAIENPKEFFGKLNSFLEKYCNNLSTEIIK